MSKKTRKIIDNTKFFLDRAPKKAADADLEFRQKSLERLGLHWNNFQSRVIIQSRKLEELPELLNLFAWEIERDAEIHEDVRANFLKLVYLKMGDLHGRLELQKHIIQVMADCPKLNWDVQSENGKTIKTNAECGWGGLMVVRRAEFDAGTIKVECPQCKGKLTRKDLIKPEEVPVPPAPNRFVRYRKGNIRPTDIHKFNTLEEFQAITFVQIYMNKPGFSKLTKRGQEVYTVVNDGPQLIGRVEFPDKLEVEELTPSRPTAEDRSTPQGSPAGATEATGPANSAEPAGSAPAPGQ